MERLFCPQCGNAALEKVEMAVGEGGAEQYGVRRKHVIRGTRFSLPKPKVPSSCTMRVYRCLACVEMDVVQTSMQNLDRLV